MWDYSIPGQIMPFFPVKLKNENADLLEFMPAPDFSMGAQIIYSREAMSEIYKTGRGNFKMRAKYEYDKKKDNKGGYRYERYIVYCYAGL